MINVQFNFAVTAPKVTGFGRYIVSRHVTRAAADKAAKGKKGFEVEALSGIIARDLANWEI